MFPAMPQSIARALSSASDVPASVTDFDKDPVVLETDFVGGAANYEALLQAWDELGPVSVDSLIAGQPPLLDFADTSCLYSAAVLWSRSSLVETESPVEQPTAAGTSNPYVWDLQPPNVKTRQTKRVWETVGALYLSQSPIPRECYIGISILPDFRQKGLGRRACELAVQFAIEGLGLHRVQARIVSSPHSNRARSLFAALGFSHEGVHRRAVVGSAGEWADVMHMGVLDTTWAIRARIQAGTKTVWDEIFERHQREREDLLRFDERQSRLRKTSNMELVHVGPHPEPVERIRGQRECTPWPPSAASSAVSSVVPSRSSSLAPHESLAEPASDSEGFASVEGLRSEQWVHVRTALEARSQRADTSTASSYGTVGTLLSNRSDTGTQTPEEGWVSM